MNNAALVIEVWRKNQVESVHSVLACVTNAEGEILQSYGKSDFSVYLRSAAKPFQALPVIETSAFEHFKISESELALACSSHLGQDIHVDGVKSILKKAELDPSYLQNHEHNEHAEDFYNCESPIQDFNKVFKQNCSGKHAVFLAVQKFLGDNLKDYLKPQSQLQQSIINALADLADIPVKDLLESLTSDGCGAPIFSMPLKNLAQCYAELGQSSHKKYGKSLKKIYNAMANHPICMRGQGDFNTDLIQAFSGKLVAKMGYEGVYGMALKDGRGVALKILDGNMRAMPPAILYVLKELLPNEQEAFARLNHWFEPVVKNIHQLTVGRIKLRF